ncbi:LysR family transcriptional regulator [Psychrobacter sp. SZ93C1]|uniref:LysR family transcriptional regulator n=1 Tax=Psychrobacter sp. SZ93C1 TaxID=2792058 RepID=UPI0018CCFA31|nr:LysR family transcriptional regulator [Psychrobacter sp. SZ93C1]MBH0066337.1 LysR family transcriptional regulator [Psychrobacter sp. SZ93C1]
MQWDDLAYFVCLVEKQTLTACAEEMGVQHSTVARRIDHLEQTLAVNLFDRLGKRYALTPEGSMLYSQAIEVEKEIAVFERMAIDQNAMQGKVVISAPPVWANEILIPALTEFRQQFPNILVALSGEVGLSNLHHREADIAIRTRCPTQEDLVARIIGSTRYGFFANNEYLKNTHSDQWQLIEFQANARVLIWSQALMKQHAYTVAFNTNDLYMACHAARKKIGIALLPEFLAHQYPELTTVDPINRVALTARTQPTLENIHSSTLVSDNQDSISNASIPLTQDYPLYLVMHPDVRRSARVRAVADWLIASCA